MRIGYACNCINVEGCAMHSTIMKYANDKKLYEIIEANLKALKNILIYNVKHHITMFRISSDLIPFGSSDINTLPWIEMFHKQLKEIGDYIRLHDLRVSMHPGQYTLLNALDENIVKRSIQDLLYHCDVLDLMGLDATHKMVLHIGGIYGDKQAAMKRFVQVYRTLPQRIKNRLVIENDDRYYTMEDVLSISHILQIPVVFDNLHHHLHHSETLADEALCIQYAKATWKLKDGNYKLHYSEQDHAKRKGAHAKHIDMYAFLAFARSYGDSDIMIEVKDKNISANKAVHLLTANQSFFDEWNTYRYLFYLHSLSLFVLYEELFKEKKDMDRIMFYEYTQQFMEHDVKSVNEDMLIHFIEKDFKLSDKKQTFLQNMIHTYEKRLITFSSCVEKMYRLAMREKQITIQQSLYLLVENA